MQLHENEKTSSETIVPLVALTLRHSHFGSKMAGQYSAESLRDYYVKDGIHRALLEQVLGDLLKSSEQAPTKAWEG